MVLFVGHRPAGQVLVDNVHLRYEDANEANPFSLGATLQHLKVYPWRDDVTGADAPEEDTGPGPAAGGGSAGPRPPSPVSGTDGSAADRNAPPAAPVPPQRHSRWNLKTFFKRSVRICVADAGRAVMCHNVSSGVPYVARPSHPYTAVSLLPCLVNTIRPQKKRRTRSWRTW